MILVNKDTLELFEVFSLSSQIAGLLNFRNERIFFTIDDVRADFEFIGYI